MNLHSHVLFQTQSLDKIFLPAQEETGCRQHLSLAVFVNLKKHQKEESLIVEFGDASGGCKRIATNYSIFIF